MSIYGDPPEPSEDEIECHRMSLADECFRDGWIACREYMAKFVEAQSPEIAASIRANWDPSLGAQPT